MNMHKYKRFQEMELIPVYVNGDNVKMGPLPIEMAIQQHLLSRMKPVPSSLLQLDEAQVVLEYL
jgi:hypothetical protein